ncbi:hypothetical protein K502DRAFT_362621 [Neoconidiobolus thromboides FSU 785]|nr:hypothetical protein K502DRAFT_362621 [Neoconidiobolus thromboides FSU 785]
MNCTIWMRSYINLYTIAIIFNILNIGFYCLILAASVLCILNEVVNVVVINSFSGVSCLLLVVNEIHTSKLTYNYFKFLVTFRGRGLLYLLLSFIVYQKGIDFNLVVTYFGVSLGLFFFIISFVPHILPLNDLRNNWRNYQGFLYEINDPSLEEGYFNTTDMTSTLSPFVPNDDTLRPGRKQSQLNSTLRGSKELLQPSRKNVNSKLLPIKGQATLTMEINQMLSDIQYSDFEFNNKDKKENDRQTDLTDESSIRDYSDEPLSSSNHIQNGVASEQSFYVSENISKSLLNDGENLEGDKHDIRVDESPVIKQNFTLRKSPFGRKQLPSVPKEGSSL